MTVTTDRFAEMENALQQGGVAALLDELAGQLKSEKKFHELYEARKMQVRRRLGLPPLSGNSADELPDDVRVKLEDGLIEACREVGMLLLHEGRIQDGWMYLRAFGDRDLVARELAAMEANDDNLEEIVGVALHEGVAPEFGFRLVLENYGTCNAITSFETAMQQHGRRSQQAAAGMLVAHVHGELLASVKGHVAQQEGEQPKEISLADLVADREWLFSEGSYHIDTTHLASTVRFARILEDRDGIRLAIDLTEYGRRLSAPFQYPGEPPFEDHYPAHALYLRALIGESVDEAVEFFRRAANENDPDESGTIPIEVYIDFLARLRRYDEAVEATLKFLTDGRRSLRFAPSLLELSQQAGSFDGMIGHYRGRDDLLGFAAGLICAQTSRRA